MNQIPNIEETNSREMETILEVLPHLILGNAEELYNNPDGEMAKNTISEMQRVIRETLHQQLQKAREEVKTKVLAFTEMRTDERYDPVMGEAFLMRNKGYNDGMRAVATFIHSELDQDCPNCDIHECCSEHLEDNK